MMTKTDCTTAILKWFGIPKAAYNHCDSWFDMERILRACGFDTYGQRDWDMFYCFHGISVAKTRGYLRFDRKDDDKYAFYCAQLPGHVILLNGLGDIVVDTSPRISDRRKVSALINIYHVGSDYVVDGSKRNRANMLATRKAGRNGYR